MKTEIKERIAKIKKGEVPEEYKIIDKKIIPIYWKMEMMKKLVERVRKPVIVEQEKKYKQIGIRSHGKGIFYKEEVTGLELGNKSVFWIEPECFIVNIVFAWEMAVAKTTNQEKGMIASHRFPMYTPLNNKLNIDFLTYFFKTKWGKNLLELASPGGAGRNKTLGQNEFLQLKMPVPLFAEQQKINEIFATWDKAIELKEKLIEAKKEQKRGLMKKLLTGEVRLSGFEGEWKRAFIKDLLDYEQPGKYIEKDIVNYSENLIPVLTANKAFIIGSSTDNDGVYENIPAIIFDDFTRDSKYVDFRFKIRSSAIKLLKNKIGISDLRFMYELLKIVEVTVGDHKRYYISEYKDKLVMVPEINEQNAIANVSETVSKELDLLEKELSSIKLQRKGLIQLLLTGIVRVQC